MQIILFAIGKVVQRVFVWLVVVPLLLIAATPIILVRGWILAARKRQRFRYAVADGYDAVWTLWCGALVHRS